MSLRILSVCAAILFFVSASVHGQAPPDHCVGLNLEMVRSFFKCMGDKFPKVNEGNFYPTGRAVSGQEPYGKLYEWRCQTILDAMQKAGYEFR